MEVYWNDSHGQLKESGNSSFFSFLCWILCISQIDYFCVKSEITCFCVVLLAVLIFLPLIFLL